MMANQLSSSSQWVGSLEQKTSLNGESEEAYSVDLSSLELLRAQSLRYMSFQKCVYGWLVKGGQVMESNIYIIILNYMLALICQNW